jgi:hypothetical protein
MSFLTSSRLVHLDERIELEPLEALARLDQLADTIRRSVDAERVRRHERPRLQPHAVEHRRVLGEALERAGAVPAPVLATLRRLRRHLRHDRKVSARRDGPLRHDGAAPGRVRLELELFRNGGCEVDFLERRAQQGTDFGNAPTS